MKLSLAYLTGIIEEVPPERWKDLFDAVGWPASLAKTRESITHEAILTAFRDDELSDELLEGLEALDTLGTEAGREAIEAALADQHLLPDILPANEGDRVFALRLFIGQRTDAALADVFARAQIQIQQAAGHRPIHEFLGRDARRITSAKKKAKQLEEATRKYCRERNLGEYVHVRAIDDDDVCVFRVIRSHHTKRPLAIIDGRTAHATIEYRPVHVDILRYDMVRGHLRIVASAASVVEFYRRTLGVVLFEDGSFFDGEPLCSLHVLQERGRSALVDHRVAGVGQVWMTECLWEHGDRERLHLRSPDCFRRIERLGLSLSEGVFVQAKLKMQVAGKSTRPVTINVRVPSRIDVRPKWQESLADKYLSAIGVRTPARVAPRIDLWSLSPWRQPVSVWRDLLGKEMENLIKHGALVPTQLEALAHPEHAGAGHVLDVHELPGGGFYGASQMESIPSRSLTATDLDALEFQPEPFRLYLRSVLGISTGGAECRDDDGLLHLGLVDLGGPRLYVTYALRPLAPGIGAGIRSAAGAAHPVVLIPTARCDESELPKVMLVQVMPRPTDVIRDAVATCGLKDAAAPIYSAPDGARLIVDTRRGQIWMDGELVENLEAGTQPFHFGELLARRNPSAVSAEDMCAALSPGRAGDTQVARRAKMNATNAIRKALDAAGKRFEDPFQTVRGSYRCTVLSHVI